MAIVVSGASGELGTQVAQFLLEQVNPSDLILLTRSPEKLSWASEKGAQIRQADFDDTDQLTKALQGGRY